MSIFPPVSSPRAAISDFAAVLRRDGSRQRILGLTLSVLITLIILIIFFVDSKINTAPPPRVIYVEPYKPGRTDAEIVAQQQKDSAELKAAKLERRRQFQKLEKKLGM